jgi:Flp pilus assembly protein TadG
MSLRARSRRGTPSPSTQTGQSLVEFALIAIPALLLVLGIAQFGFLLSTEVGVTNTARDVARWASTVPTTTAAQALANSGSADTEMRSRLLANVPLYSAANVATGTGISYCSYADPLGATTVRVTVAIQYRHPLFLPIISGLLDGLDGTTDAALRVGTSEAIRVENDSTATITGITAC